MNCTGTQGQACYDFYLELLKRGKQNYCCGPLAYLELNTEVVERLMYALTLVDMQAKLADAYIGMSGQDSGRFGACMGHWLDISALTSEVGTQAHRHDLEFIGEKIFRELCRTIGWDYKELDNFLQNFSIRDKEDT